MKIPAKARWSVYAIAAGLTVAAMWLVKPREDEAIVMPARASSPSGRLGPPARSGQSAAVAPDPAAPVTNDVIARLKRQIDEAIGHSGIDPFRDGPTAAELAAAAAAQAAAVAAQAVTAAQQQRTVAAAPPAPPPAPPFRYLGRWTEQGRTLAFLQSGDRVLEVRGPGPLDGSPWRVVALGDERITLQMAKGPQHTLSFEAAGNDKTTPAAAPAAAGTAASTSAPAQAKPATPAGASPSATSVQETPSSSGGIEHAPGWEEN